MFTRFGILIALFTVLCAAVFADNLQTVVINGQPMVTLRAFGDTFDAAIDYDRGRDSFSITLNDCTVDLAPYANRAWIDDRAVTLQAPVVIIDDVTYVPLRFLCDAFGLGCSWVDEYHPVTVYNPRSTFRVALGVDTRWARERHVWQYQYNTRDYVNFRLTTHGISVKVNLGNSRPNTDDRRWDHQRTPVRNNDNRWDDHRTPARTDNRNTVQPQPRDNHQGWDNRPQGQDNRDTTGHTGIVTHNQGSTVTGILGGLFGGKDRGTVTTKPTAPVSQPGHETAHNNNDNNNGRNDRNQSAGKDNQPGKAQDANRPNNQDHGQNRKER